MVQKLSRLKPERHLPSRKALFIRRWRQLVSLERTLLFRKKSWNENQASWILNDSFLVFSFAQQDLCIQWFIKNKSKRANIAFQLKLISRLINCFRLLFPHSSLSPHLALISSRFFFLSAFRLACCSCNFALVAEFASCNFRSSFADGPSSLSSSSNRKLLLIDDNLFDTAVFTVAEKGLRTSDFGLRTFVQLSSSSYGQGNK